MIIHEIIVVSFYFKDAQIKATTNIAKFAIIRIIIIRIKNETTTVAIAYALYPK